MARLSLASRLAPWPEDKQKTNDLALAGISRSPLAFVPKQSDGDYR